MLFLQWNETIKSNNFCLQGNETIQSQWLTILFSDDNSVKKLFYFSTEKAKPKSKKKEEPSSLFQRQRVDTLLLDLRSKFPPTFYQVHFTVFYIIHVYFLKFYHFEYCSGNLFSHKWVLILLSVFSLNLVISLFQVWIYILVCLSECLIIIKGKYSCFFFSLLILI